MKTGFFDVYKRLHFFLFCLLGFYVSSCILYVLLIKLYIKKRSWFFHTPNQVATYIIHVVSRWIIYVSKFDYCDLAFHMFKRLVSVKFVITFNLSRKPTKRVQETQNALEGRV